MKLTRRQRKLGKAKKEKFVDNTNTTIKENKKTIWNGTSLSTIIVILYFVVRYFSTGSYGIFLSLTWYDAISPILLVIFFTVYYKLYNRFPFTDKNEDGDDIFEAFSLVLFISVFLQLTIVSDLKTIYTNHYGQNTEVYPSIVVEKHQSTSSYRRRRHENYTIYLESSKYDRESISVSKSFFTKTHIGDTFYLYRKNSIFGYNLEIEKIEPKK